jgi:hypothetical protein
LNGKTEVAVEDTQEKALKMARQMFPGRKADIERFSDVKTAPSPQMARLAHLI